MSHQYLTTFISIDIHVIQKSYHRNYSTVINHNVAKMAIRAAPEGHSNISAVHMRDQRFSKYTLIAVFPLQEKHP